MFNLSNIIRKQRTGRVLSFADIMPGILSRYNLRQQFTIASLSNEWIYLAGDGVGSNSVPLKIEKGVLWVRTSHSIFSNEISLLKNVILSKINEKFSVNLKDIKVVR